MESVQEKLQEEKEKVINLLLLLFGAIGIPVILVSILSRVFDVGMNPSLWIQAVIGVLIVPMVLLRQKIPYAVKVSFTVSIPMIMGFGGIYTFGLIDASVMLLISSVIIASTLGGLKQGVITTLISTAYIAFVYFLISTGRHRFNVDVEEYLYFSGSWVVFGVAYAALSIVVSFLISRSFSVAYSAIERMEHQQLELEESNKTKDQLFQLIAHDLRSPFQGLISGLELFSDQESTLSEEQKGKLFKAIMRDSTSTFAMLENLLFWSKAQTGNLVLDAKYLELGVLLEECISPYQRLAEQKNITINLEIPEGLLAFADGHSVKIILCNLIHNAIKFTDEGGRIDIRASVEGSKARIIVSDNGVGVCESDREQLFSKEKSVSRKGTANEPGTGLGLGVSHELAGFNKGNIRYEENSSAGSTFILELPAGV